MKKIKRFLSGTAGRLVFPVLVLAAVLCFFTGLSNVRERGGAEGKRLLEESIRRTAAACYASEGIYPPTISYMEDHYGLQVDEKRYYVDYRAFASNLMPSFTVLEREER